jgi:hypothetical protein
MLFAPKTESFEQRMARRYGGDRPLPRPPNTLTCEWTGATWVGTDDDARRVGGWLQTDRGWFDSAESLQRFNIVAPRYGEKIATITGGQLAPQTPWVDGAPHPSLGGTTKPEPPRTVCAWCGVSTRHPDLEGWPKFDGRHFCSGADRERWIERRRQHEGSIPHVVQPVTRIDDASYQRNRPLAPTERERSMAREVPDKPRKTRVP